MCGFHITGGEPLLKPELAAQAVALALDQSIPVEYLETNGSFATDPKRAEEIIRMQRAAGLSRLLISLSPFHAEFIPLCTTVNAIRAAENVLGGDGAFVWLPEFYLEIAAISENACVSIESHGDPAEYFPGVAARYSMIQNGRAALTVSPHLQRQPIQAFYGSNCFQELFRSGHLHFDPDYNYIPGFCSGITLGDWRELEKIYRDFDLEKNPFLAKISQDIKLAVEYAADLGFIPEPEGYSGKCHLCLEMRRFLVSKVQLAELGPMHFYENL